MNGRFFTRWGKRTRVIALWTAAMTGIVIGLEIYTGTSPDPYPFDLGLWVLWLAIGAWGLGLCVIDAVARFLDWRGERRFIREVGEEHAARRVRRVGSAPRSRP
jgi:hypothetical protein